jgi:hypothetical protein
VPAYRAPTIGISSARLLKNLAIVVDYPYAPIPHWRAANPPDRIAVADVLRIANFPVCALLLSFRVRAYQPDTLLAVDRLCSNQPFGRRPLYVSVPGFLFCLQRVLARHIACGEPVALVMHDAPIGSLADIS